MGRWFIWYRTIEFALATLRYVFSCLADKPIAAVCFVLDSAADGGIDHAIGNDQSDVSGSGQCSFSMDSAALPSVTKLTYLGNGEAFSGVTAPAVIESIVVQEPKRDVPIPIDVGTAAVIVPWHDPLRVAENVAVLDLLGGIASDLIMIRNLAKLYGFPMTNFEASKLWQAR